MLPESSTTGGMDFGLPLAEGSTTGGVACGFAELYLAGVLPDRGGLEPGMTTTGGAAFGLEQLWALAYAQKGRPATWVDPQQAARSLPRMVRPSRPGRATVAGRARQGRRAAAGSRDGPDDDGDPEPALGAGGAARGRA